MDKDRMSYLLDWASVYASDADAAVDIGETELALRSIELALSNLSSVREALQGEGAEIATDPCANCPAHGFAMAIASHRETIGRAERSMREQTVKREAELCIEEQAHRDAHDYTSVRAIEVASELVALRAILHPEEVE